MQRVYESGRTISRGWPRESRREQGCLGKTSHSPEGTQYNEGMKRTALIAGDAAALLIVTLLGFRSHGEFSPAFIPHMAATFIPLCLGWFLLGPSLGLFHDSTVRSAPELWRPAFAMLFAGPFAVLLRSIVLGASLIPSFAVVLSLTLAVALTAWRLLYVLVQGRLVGPA